MCDSATIAHNLLAPLEGLQLFSPLARGIRSTANRRMERLARVPPAFFSTKGAAQLEHAARPTN
jgi:hypothetical protein